MQLGFYHNNDTCIGCNCCVIACKDKNDLPVGEKFRRVYDYAGCTWSIDEAGVSTPSDYFAYSVSVACMHCAAPACVAACPAGALQKEEADGIVWRDEELCIGCGTCAQACPFGAPYVSEVSNKSRKCDFCRDLLATGEDPACVGACPTRCLQYGDIEDLRATMGDTDNVAPLPADPGTGPSIVFKRNRLNPSGALAGVVLNAPEELESATVVF
ncbi:MAG: 4Fe-4S dicluster domain-containing protein [Coriobacteriales bacterium]|jgi:anaerobic dimethyl sulfoxide reductase subunit B (iron-sulfur subunit)|nr:4Fe-4S dicluster domain-containing protein [Coriobacteriales bacterium]